MTPMRRDGNAPVMKDSSWNGGAARRSARSQHKSQRRNVRWLLCMRLYCPTGVTLAMVRPVSGLKVQSTMSSMLRVVVSLIFWEKEKCQV